MLPDKYHHFYGAGDRRCVISYALWRDVAVTLADPVGPPGVLSEAILDFDLFCAKPGLAPVFYETPEESAQTYRAAGFRTFKVAEDACIDLKAFTSPGGKFQNLRTSLNKIRKTGWRYEWFRRQRVGVLRCKPPSCHFRRMAFHAARHRNDVRPRLFHARVASARRTLRPFRREEPARRFRELAPLRAGNRPLDRPHAASLNPSRGRWTPLLPKVCWISRRRGLAQASLGNAPLANIESGSVDSLEEKVIRYLFERFDAYYGYKSLFEFKRKFHPNWRGRHVAYRSVAHLLPAAAAIVRVHLPTGFFKYIRS